MNGKKVQRLGYCSDIWIDETIKFLDNTSEPSFVYLALNAPHSPWNVDEKYSKPYLDAGADKNTANIYGMVTNLDKAFGRLLNYLEDSGKAQNSIVIFMSDNGPNSVYYTAGLNDKKASVYDGGIRVPFLIRWPEKFKKDIKIDRIAMHIDLLPTLMDACKIPERDGFDGKSLMPLLTGNAGEWPDRTLFQQIHRGDKPQKYRNFMVRNQKYKLVQPVGKKWEALPENPEFLLFDMENDPGEQNNIAANKQEIVAKMLALYENWFEDVTTPLERHSYIP